MQKTAHPDKPGGNAVLSSLLNAIVKALREEKLGASLQNAYTALNETRSDFYGK